MKKDVHRGCAPQKAKEYVEGFDESPAVRIQLGWSNVNLCQQFALKPGEGQAHADALEDHLVEVEEGDPIVGPFVSAIGSPKVQGSTVISSSCLFTKAP